MSYCYPECMLKILTFIFINEFLSLLYHYITKHHNCVTDCRIYALSVWGQSKSTDHKPLPQMCVTTSLDICNPYYCIIHVPTPSDTWSGSRDGRNKSVVDCPSLNTRHLHHYVSRLSDQVGLSQITAQHL
jgi:hypothetical protein